MDDIYREAILDLYRNPLNKGVLDHADTSAQDFSTSCGDDITVYIKYGAGDTIMDIAHNGQGCAISQAAVSLVTDAVKGKTKQDALEMTPQDVYDLLHIPISYTRQGCALLGLSTIKKAISNK